MKEQITLFTNLQAATVIEWSKCGVKLSENSVQPPLANMSKTVHTELLALGLYTKLYMQSCWLLVYIQNCPYRVVGSWFIYKNVHTELLALGLYTKLSIQSCWLLVYIQNCPYRVVGSWFIYSLLQAAFQVTTLAQITTLLHIQI